MQNLMICLIDFGVHFLMNFEGFGKQKSLKSDGGVINFEIFWFLVEDQFLINFWSIWEPKWAPKWRKINPKINQYFECFLDRFLTILGSILAPKID